MVRIAGVNIPEKKRLEVALTYIYGIGRHKSLSISQELNIDKNTRVHDLTEDQVRKIREVIDSSHTVEGNLKSEVMMNIKNLIDMKSYRGSRHIAKLPVRGQRTHTNARTRKGKAVPIAGKKKAVK